jgi:macrolide transport system ATP-binding/permease protein
MVETMVRINKTLGEVMGRLVQIFRKLRILVRREKFTRELQEEMSFHREQAEKEFVVEGMPAEEASYAAKRQFGNDLRLLDESHRIAGFGFESVWQDLRFALRQLRKNPGFALTAILILTLGIGASVTIFSFVDAALIKPLPYQDPSRLVVLFESNSLGPRFHLSYLDYLDFKRLNTVFTSLDLYAPSSLMLQTPTGVQKADGTRVSAGFFHTLGVSPVLGRDFRPTDDQPSAPRTILLSYAAWQKRYGGRRDVLGQMVVLDGEPAAIVGVLPRSFHFAPAEPSDFWETDSATRGCEKDRGCHNFFGVGRLKQGVSLATALADFKTIAQQLERQFPDDDRGRGAFMMTLIDVIIGDIRPILLVLLAGAALLLLIAAINVTSLLLVRSESRKREMAVRGALGASRARLVLQLMTEGVLLAGSAGVLGTGLAYLAMRFFVGLIPKDVLASMPYLQDMGLNARVMAFAALISFATALLFSLLPALRVSPSELREGLTQSGRGFAGTVWRRFGSNLVVAELTMAVVLLVCAGLLGKSFYRLLHVDTGLQPDHLAAMQVAGEGPAYAKDPQKIALERQIHARLARLPGVKSVALASDLPLGDGDGITGIRVAGRPYRGEHNEVAIRRVSSGYFSTLQARLQRGRYFGDEEDGSRPLVAVVNQQLGKQFFPGEDPVGRQIFFEGSEKSLIEIVGVVNDIQEGQLDAAPRSAIYLPFNQSPTSDFAVVLRTSQAEDSLLVEAAAAIHNVDPGLAVFDPITMSERLHDSPSASLHRSSAWLVGGFAALALLLSIVGLYGVIAYSVSQRTREIGVRMALGAQRGEVCWLILREASGLAAMGIGAGLLCSLAATTLMRKLLFEVHAWDLPTLASVPVVLAAAALLASYLPARRAASVNPTDALHAE